MLENSFFMLVKDCWNDERRVLWITMIRNTQFIKRLM